MSDRFAPTAGSVRHRRAAERRRTGRASTEADGRANIPVRLCVVPVPVPRHVRVAGRVVACSAVGRASLCVEPWGRSPLEVEPRGSIVGPQVGPAPPCPPLNVVRFVGLVGRGVARHGHGEQRRRRQDGCYEPHLDGSPWLAKTARGPAAVRRANRPRSGPGHPASPARRGHTPCHEGAAGRRSPEVVPSRRVTPTARGEPRACGLPRL